MPTGLPWNKLPRRPARSALRSSASDFLCCGVNFRWREGNIRSAHRSSADNSFCSERSSFDVGCESYLPITVSSVSLPPCALPRRSAKRRRVALAYLRLLLLLRLHALALVGERFPNLGHLQQLLAVVF